MTLLHILFWLAFAFDLAALGLLFVLGLAAAPSAKTSSLAVTVLLLLLPGLTLTSLAFWFLRVNSLAAKLVPCTLVAAPLLVLVCSQLLTTGFRFAHPTEASRPAAIQLPPLTDLQNAVLANDVPAVTQAAAAAGLPGRRDAAGVLILALHRLKSAPEQLSILRALLAAGADPNAAYGELPLEVAIRTGLAPVALLLQAGADPNRNNPLGDPVFFAAMNPAVDPAILPLLLEHGANRNARSVRGESALSSAAAVSNWKAVLLLLAHGASIQQAQTPEGESFPQQVERSVRLQGERGDLAAVVRLVRNP
jgi:hypothetical protein